MSKGQAPGVTWWIEFDDGGRPSATYASEEEAWAALTGFESPKAQMSLLRRRRPASLVSSDGLRFAIPTKTDR
jgi:hypothetical protein